MLKVTVCIQNITTDEEDKYIELPISTSELSEKLMKHCDYIIIECDYEIWFENCDDIFKLNEILDKIATENPLLEAKHLENIYKASDYRYLDDEELVEKLCKNDFMYEEVDIPRKWFMDYTGYAAYLLFTKHGVPFSPVSSDIINLYKTEEEYDDWDSIWDVYQYMGFRVTEDEENYKKMYIVNMEDSDEKAIEHYHIIPRN